MEYGIVGYLTPKESEKKKQRKEREKKEKQTTN